MTYIQETYTHKTAKEVFAEQLAPKYILQSRAMDCDGWDDINSGPHDWEIMQSLAKVSMYSTVQFRILKVYGPVLSIAGRHHERACDVAFEKRRDRNCRWSAETKTLEYI